MDPLTEPSVPAIQIELAVEVERQPGSLRVDGSLDFREVNFTPTVRPGQVLARAVQALVPPSPDGSPPATLPRAGDGVAEQLEGGAVVYRASSSGVVHWENGVLSVVRELQIDGPVSYQTGNLEFDGDVAIRGPVVQGFSVKATGAVTIGGAIEPGAMVRAEGDLTVAGGILGHRTQAAAAGSVRTLFVHEAQVAADGDLLIGRTAYMARLRAGGRIRVGNGTAGTGALVGGQAWAGTSIEAGELGGPSHPATAVMAGVDPQKARELDRIRQQADLAHVRLLQLVQRFGLTTLDVDQIRNMIAAAVGPRRKVLVNRARQLGELAQAYRQLVVERRTLAAELTTRVQGAEIKVYGAVHPGVEVRLGEHRHVVAQPLAGAQFRVIGDELVHHLAAESPQEAAA
jgi:hypothetical protein